MRQRPARSALFPYTTLFRSTKLFDPPGCNELDRRIEGFGCQLKTTLIVAFAGRAVGVGIGPHFAGEDRKSTRLNSSHSSISYAVFCLKKKTKTTTQG